MNVGPAVRLDHDGAIGTITLDRPANRNSMTAELLDAFSSALAAARAVPSLRCLIITGTGPCFSAGADFKAILQRGDEDGGRPRAPTSAASRCTSRSSPSSTSRCR